MMRPEHLISWNTLAVKISGERLQTIARDLVLQRRLPLRQLELLFADGALNISGKVIAILPLPFAVSIRKIIAGRTSIRIPIESASAFGFLPIPKLFLHLAEGRMKMDGVTFDAETSTLHLALDRFLPDFLDVEIEAINLVAGGVEVRLGAGGATPPLNLGGLI